MEEMEMAKKTVQVVPEIIDSVEGLNAKMAAMQKQKKLLHGKKKSLPSGILSKSYLATSWKI